MGRKPKNRWSHEDCKRIIKENRDNTAWFCGECSQDMMWEMLRYRMGFGEAETAVILSSLILVGAKFS